MHRQKTFLLRADDPAAPAALKIYAARSWEIGKDEKYVADILSMASDWEASQESAIPDPMDDPVAMEEVKPA